MHFPGLKEALAKLDGFDEVMPLLRRIADGVDRLVELESERNVNVYNINTTQKKSPSG